MPNPWFARFGAILLLAACSGGAKDPQVDDTDPVDPDPGFDCPPDRVEACNGLDDDCDGEIDEGVQQVFYRDNDGDLFGQDGAATFACQAPAGFVPSGGDCIDFNAAIFPGAPELCNEADDDCNGIVDDGLDLIDLYPDLDGDGFAPRGARAQQACDVGVGLTTAVDLNNDGIPDWDCDDSNTLANPSADERCNGEDDDCDQLIDELDADGDGYAGCPLAASRDCDDGDDDIHPGTAEVCDNVDQDCDGQVDEGLITTWYADNDGDGYGEPSATLNQCGQPVGYVAVAGDCQDFNLQVHPGAPEQCNGLDDDCNGVADDDVQSFSLYPDNDGDGVPLRTVAPVTSCVITPGLAEPVDVDADGRPDWDCDDAATTVFPGADERCNGADDDCDLLVDELDADGDGYAGCPLAANRDCDDADVSTVPGAVETCDGADDNCNGIVDEGALRSFYRDNDGDGYGQDAARVEACEAPPTYVERSGDCVDYNAAIHPGAAEQCNDADDDCSGIADDNLTQYPLYPDIDGDGFPPATTSVQSDCEVPLGFATPRDVTGDGAPDYDCDDSSTVAFPGATERCNGQDDDCDLLIDETDVDGDGYSGCPLAASRDCDDSDPAVSPGAVERCDGVDQNCNGSVDEGVLATWYRDNDRDSFGQDAATVLGCTQPLGFVAVPGDCVDFNAAIHPDAVEQCNSADDDCDGLVDDDVAVFDLYPDVDGDSFPPDTPSVQSGCQVPPGFTTPRDADGDGAPDFDCDDSSTVAFPGATERCNGQDDDCDLVIDEIDLDEDGFFGCPLSANRDCDDTEAGVYPGAAEDCDGVDQNCNTLIDEGVLGTFFRDDDQDGWGQAASSTSACTAPAGFVARVGDCADRNPAVNPDAAELCNGADDDCDDVADDGLALRDSYPDRDGDGFPATGSQAVQGCLIPAGFVALADRDSDGEPEWDCDDSLALSFPGAAERCNASDDDCDALVDEIDADNDGFYGCALVANRDCDDGDASIRPSALETCDGVDQDCDGQVDESVLTTWYRDNDGDGYGQDAANSDSCTAPAGFVAAGGDCVDYNTAIHPDASEACNGADDDCNGVADDALPVLDLYPDSDGDGVPPETTNVQNDCRVPLGFTTAVDLDSDGEPDWDCDDLDAGAFPGSTERCNGADDDCNLLVDEVDADEDGYSGCLTAVRRDCDDASALVSPGAAEVCDGADQNCNSLVDEGVLQTFFRDNDGDGYGQDAASVSACAAPVGYATRAGDCVDFNVAIRPGASEACNEADDDCNGLVDDGLTLLNIYPDLDGDGFASSAVNQRQKCDVPLGFAISRDTDNNGSPNWDCDDLDTLSYPGAREICGDGVDNGCVGVADRLCFTDCDGVWPYSLPVSESYLDHITPADLDGDGESEILVGDDFGFAILDFTGEVLTEYADTVYNYSRSRPVLADVDDYDQFSGSRQTLEVVSGNGSRPRIYKLNGDDSISEYLLSTDEVYDASRFMVRDMDNDGTPEFFTSTWCEANGTEIFRYDRATRTISKVNVIADPNSTCEYTDGRVLTDLDGDGKLELLFGNGYGDATQPRYWGGNLHATRFTNLTTLTSTPHCVGCFQRPLAGWLDGYVGEVFRIGDEIRSTIIYFQTNTPGAANPNTVRYWRHDPAGGAIAGYPTTAATIWNGTTDLDRDGTLENLSEVAWIGLYDVNGDSYPDRVSHSGARIRLALWDPARDTFVDQPDAAHEVSTANILVHSMWDVDDDGRLDVFATDQTGRLYCKEMGPNTFNRSGIIPPHYSMAYRTFQWDNYEPNEGGDTNADGVPDGYVRIPSALSSSGDFYGYFSSLMDRDYYLMDAAYGGAMCVTGPPGATFRMSVYSFQDRFNNVTKAAPGDGIVDGLVWESSDGSTTKCFNANNTLPRRQGEFRYVLGIEPTGGTVGPEWPYWVSAPK